MKAPLFALPCVVAADGSAPVLNNTALVLFLDRATTCVTPCVLVVFL